ncbi:hypothetical protein WDU94_012291, partial [Cyamophila willieti]
MSLKQLYHRRAVLLGELADVGRHVGADNGIESLQLDLQEVESSKKQFEDLQQAIDDHLVKSNADEDVLQAEITVRRDFKLEWKKLVVLIKAKLASLNVKTNTERDCTRQTPSSTVHHGKVNFIPYDSDHETVSNFLHRLDTYLDLISCDDDHAKVLVLLNSLDPRVHKDLCASVLPSDPRNKSFRDLTAALKHLLEGQRNVYVEQHMFITRVQDKSESIQKYSVALKNLTISCNFLCECGKRIDESFLKLQFIRGINDPEIRQALLQIDYNVTFETLVNKASAIELAKREDTDISNVKSSCSTAETFSLNSKGQRRATTQTSSVSRNVNRQARKSREKCFRCGRSNHDSDSCFFKNAKCHKCKQVGHLSKRCKSNSYVNEVENPSDNDISDQDEINCLKIKCSDKMFLSVIVDNVPLKMELDTGAAVSTIS